MKKGVVTWTSTSRYKALDVPITRLTSMFTGETQQASPRFKNPLFPFSRRERNQNGTSGDPVFTTTDKAQLIARFGRRREFRRN